jgi:glycosyltransferase involved in cell wall biosynthesis
MTPGILFVSHDATRTGAPKALLHFLHWFKSNGRRPFSVLLGGGGELTVEFEQVACTWPMNVSRWGPERLRTKFLVASGVGKWAHSAEAKEVQKFAARSSPALVYVNSIASARALDLLSPRVPVLTHVHELESFFRVQPETALSGLLKHTRQFIAGSDAVKENLLCRHGVPAERVETVHESVPVGEIQAERSREQVLQELRIPNDAHLVIGSGTEDWRKGIDLFVLLAREICRKRADVYFAWMGGADLWRLEHDIRLAGLVERVRLTGAVVKYLDYLAAADVFALTSREDPYPLVCLEAAALGKPLVCFANAGGMPELVKGDCGFVVPYLDVAAMAERVIGLLEVSECRLKMGVVARSKILEHHDITVSGPRILGIIERTIAGG